MYGAYSGQWHSCKPLSKNQGTYKQCNVILGVYYRPAVINQWLSEELRDLQLNLPEVNWEHHTADGSAFFMVP